MTSANCVLGLDGGGSHTVCVILDMAGVEVGRGVSGPSNHQSVGEKAASHALAEAMDAARKSAGNPDLAAICWGMAGLDRPEDRTIIQRMAEQLLPDHSVQVVHDSLIALVGGTEGGRTGVVIIAGTGSIAVGYHPSGRSARVGGWGHVLGDEGSGHYIALRGLNTATRALDGRGPETVLVERFIETAGSRSFEDLVNRIYLENWSAPEIAGLAPAVLSAADMGDEQAVEIIDDSARELALTARVVIESLDMENESFEVVLSGGIFKGCSRMVDLIRQELESLNPGIGVILARREPVIGAGLIALEAVNTK
jgi:N-acetylglucosamine kinase-like BadF-type ATPase